MIYHSPIKNIKQGSFFMQYVINFSDVNMTHLETVGGKNASLGEMIQHVTRVGIKVPEGFATTADAFRDFLSKNQLDEKINQCLRTLNAHNLEELKTAGRNIRQWILAAEFSAEFSQAIKDAYAKLHSKEKFEVAVRSSATSEDLPDASFAGQQESFLNVRNIEDVLLTIKQVYASLYNDRAISYRVDHGFVHDKVAISAGIQRMVRSDCGVSGVAFSIDTESGFDQVILITASYGLGEAIVQGSVNPDEFYVHKPTLKAGKFAILRRNLGDKASKIIYADSENKEQYVKTVEVPSSEREQFSLKDEDVQKLSDYVIKIEDHYRRPMDIEWAKDGIDGEIYILQARPETVKSRATKQIIEQYELKEHSKVKTEGRSIGQKIGQGPARVISSPEQMDLMQKGDVLVTDMTDPDWEPIMKIASAIVTNRGGRTCHAAIIARELGIPAVVGCGNATDVVQNKEEITVSCAEGDTGFVYEGLIKYQHHRIEVGKMPELPFKICLNLGNPDKAFNYQSLPNNGVGLARLEFIINQMIGIHPTAVLQPETMPEAIRKEIAKRTAAYTSPVEFYIEKLREGISTIAASFSPKMVIVRLSDFKSNEYANLLGGQECEPHEENPMIGFRGASRYIAESFEACFALECEALKRVRNDMGLKNVWVMVPFVRTINEAKQVILTLEKYGLKRGVDDLKLIMMCEIPSNALLADQFLDYFDGFSIGSNDLTQLTLGLDRDSGLVSAIFDERNEAVKILLHKAIQTCKERKKYIGICGQGPSDYPDFAEWLMKEGIESISLSPDSVIKTWLYLAEKYT